MLKRILNGEMINYPLNNTEHSYVVSVVSGLIEKMSIEKDKYNETAEPNDMIPYDVFDTQIRFEVDIDKLVIFAK